MLISAIEISKSFDGKKVLDKANFYADNGEIIGIIGASGSGKSVLIKILLRLISPDSGSLSISPNSSIGFSMQNNSLYDYLTVKQNLDYFARIFGVPSISRRGVVHSLLKRLNLEVYENVLVKNISGGTKKRVDIACALVNNPDILIMDEPLLGLDPNLVDGLSSLVRELNKEGKTIILSSHRIEELSKICSKLVLVKDGKTFDVDKSRIREVYK